MGVPEADDHRRSLPGDTTGGPSQDTELGHGTRQQPLLDQGASHGSPGPALKQRQLGRNSRNLKGNYLCKTPVIKKIQAKQWYGAGNPRNRAALYGLPKDEMAGGYLQWLTSLVGKESKGESIYITDNSVFSELDIQDFISEIERLNRT